MSTLDMPDTHNMGESILQTPISGNRAGPSCFSSPTRFACKTSNERTLRRAGALAPREQRADESSEATADRDNVGSRVLDPQMSALAALWGDALSGFARAGGSVILLDGATPASGTWLLARESGLLAVSDATDADAITLRLVPTAAADAVASGVDVLFVASRNTVRYRVASSAYAVFADNADMTRPVVLHRAVLP